ncbi:helicase [Streptomyces canarius]
MDAAGLWTGADTAPAAFAPRARADALLALRRAARAWPPLTPLLSAAVPDAVDLADDEIAELLGEGARALAAVGVDVHWPRHLARGLTAHAAIGPPDDGAAPSGTSAMPSFLSADERVTFSWWFDLGGRELSREELDRLAEAERPWCGWRRLGPGRSAGGGAGPDRAGPVRHSRRGAGRGSDGLDGGRRPTGRRTAHGGGWRGCGSG